MDGGASPPLPLPRSQPSPPPRCLLKSRTSQSAPRCTTSASRIKRSLDRQIEQRRARGWKSSSGDAIILTPCLAFLTLAISSYHTSILSDSPSKKPTRRCKTWRRSGSARLAERGRCRWDG
ncbi:hypothetical protein SCHPADRAFT_214292 [Schizopora paradoxa]|uniref:Uncharacterized protein n=1 Tax=Schizopora paradoxa TaxID=27342 RepID=A0A0H2RXX0_9AGAM|nr:hypothetical protein SCHPADRAFT_214292 [Schizopora paradoxa]